ncbi:MAG: RNA polymerase sigma factor [Gemmataceae bacterium]
MSKLAVEMPERTARGAWPHPDDLLVEAFNAIRAELVSTLYFVLGNQDDAQDAAQDAFLKCWRSRQGVTDVHNLKAWIFRVGLNAAKDLRRSAWRRKAKPLADSAAQTLPCSDNHSPSDNAVHQECLNRLRATLLDLRPEEQEVFLLRQNGSLTYEEIADLRHTPVGTIKTQMRSALQKLRVVLREKGEE